MSPPASCIVGHRVPPASQTGRRTTGQGPPGHRKALEVPACGTAPARWGHGKHRHHGERASQWDGLRGAAFETISSRASYDFRTRIQTVSKEAQDQLEEIDPGRSTAELKAWLDARLTAELHDHQGGIVAAAREFSGRAARHFALDPPMVVDPPGPRTGSDLDTSRLAVHKKKTAT